MRKWLYRSIVPLFVLLPLIWLILNRFRSALYDSGINNPESAYHRVVLVQDYVMWITVVLFPFVLVIALLEIVHWVLLKISRRPII